MKPLFEKYCTESFSDDGRVKEFRAKADETFNFAYDVVDAIAAEEPSRRALVWCNDRGMEREFTFGEIAELSNRTANYFARHGVKKGDSVMLMMKRNFEYWYVILALHKLGAIAVPATFMLKKEDIIYRVNKINIKYFVCSTEDNICENVRDAVAGIDNVKKLFCIRREVDGFERLDTGIEDEPAEFERVKTNASEPFLTYFTSGTTGDPKIVSHNYYYPLGHIPTARYWQNVQDGGLHLSLADTGWAKAAWGKLYGQWLCGTAIMVYDYNVFSGAALLKVLKKYGVTSFCAPPTIYRFLVKNGLVKNGFADVKQAATAGEAINSEILDQFRKTTGLEIRSGFGQTESVLLIADLVNEPIKVGSMGKPLPFYDIRIIDDDGNRVPPNTQGEIAIFPKTKIAAGLCLDDKSETSVWKDGVYHTGDVATYDEDGYFWFVGRKDDVIKSSGYRISPFEIESVLIRHPQVAECAVTGIKDSDRGFAIKATVVLRKGFEGTPALAKELQRFVKKNTADYKTPRVVEFVDELPKTYSGKIQHRVIRDKSN